MLAGGVNVGGFRSRLMTRLGQMVACESGAVASRLEEPWRVG